MALVGFLIKKTIEQIKIGDKVLSYDEKTKRFEYKTVAQTFIAVKENIVKIKIRGEKLLTTTTEHLFYVKKTPKARDGLNSKSDDENGEWLTASELKVGQKVLRPDGKWTRITSIEQSTEPTLVYNLEVEGNHNYFVGEIGVLSHNCNISGALDWSIIKQATGETRQAHVGLHNINNAAKASHGVFFDDGVAVVNEAWNLGLQNGARRVSQGSVDIVEVNMGRQIGVLGGVEGSEAYVPLNSVRFVLEAGTNRLITAYPF